MPYAVGLDYGTNSVRCVIVDTKDGREVGTNVFEYEHGEAGVVLDSSDHNLARQNPEDYLKGLEVTVKGAVAEAKKTEKDFDPQDIIGIGVDTTGDLRKVAGPTSHQTDTGVDAGSDHSSPHTFAGDIGNGGNEDIVPDQHVVCVASDLTAR